MALIERDHLVVDEPDLVSTPLVPAVVFFL